MIRRLTDRERRLLLLCGAAMGAWFAIALAILPLAQDRADSRARIHKADAIAELLATTTTLTQAPATARPLASVLTRRAEAANISIRRLDPSQGAISVTLDETPYPSVIDWLAVLTGDDGLRVASLEMERLTAPGMVSARIVLEPGR
ncbi:type II secretion system protein GspM [uncultured Roseobacter sp.]|uniref:type II secretion system protein GspM n=1 Tax=uncultured Roseobacter sp. TaxID=114847 RepID=UPI0026197490|nr:type II secretion system protein GspM [uncultured Roseobacter sp.]